SWGRVSCARAGACVAARAAPRRPPPRPPFGMVRQRDCGAKGMPRGKSGGRIAPVNPAANRRRVVRADLGGDYARDLYSRRDRDEGSAEQPREQLTVATGDFVSSVAREVQWTLVSFRRSSANS